jgi:hypothetical protein
MSVRAVILSTVIALVSLSSIRQAAAEDPNVVFAGKIMVSDKKFPSSAKSPSAYVAAIRKLAKSNFTEDKETHTWKIYFAGFLKSPLNDVEYIVKIVELSGKSSQVLATLEQYTDTRGEKTISSYLTLDKKVVGVNKQLQMTMESKGKVLASAQFKILGEGEKFSGKVNFSDDDKDDDSK